MTVKLSLMILNSDDESVEEVEENDVEKEEVGSVRIEEETCKVLSTHFGDITRNDQGDESGEYALSSII